MKAEGLADIDYMGIHDAFAASPYGQTLAGRVRYEKFKPPETSHERWEELLGPDVNNLRHLSDTYHLTCNFISLTERQQPDEFTPLEAAIMKTGAVIHDWGEGLPGLKDISYSDKTAADEATEREVFMDHLSSLQNGMPEETKTLVYEAATTIIFTRDTRLGRVFNAIERIGYTRTGLRADEHVQLGTAPDCEEGLRWLSAEVLSNHHTSSLIALSGRYTAIHHFLESFSHEISLAFENVDPAIFQGKLSPLQAHAKEQAVKDASDIWQAWLGTRV